MNTTPSQKGSRRGNLRCLIALELGGNFGHLIRCIALAKQLRNRGCEVLFAVPDSRTAFQFLAPQGLPFIQAPRVRAGSRKAASPINYADLLLRKGFADPEALSAAVQSWRGVFSLFQPDMLISDFSPTALLAARVCTLPTVAVGNGFFIPPNVSPWPSIRPWDNIPLASLQAADDAFLGRINQILAKWRRPAMHTPSELFAGTRILATFAELDHYGTRHAERYAGVFYGVEGGRKVEWPLGQGKRVLVYLRPDVPGFGATLQYLRSSHHRVVFVGPGTHAAHIRRFSADHLLFSNTPVVLGPLLDSADLAVGYGSIGFVTQTLRAGLPQLMLPPYVEQALFARQVSALGAGITLDNQRDATACALAIKNLLEEPQYRRAARAFAVRHKDYAANAVAEQLAQQIIDETMNPSRHSTAEHSNLSSSAVQIPLANHTFPSEAPADFCAAKEGARDVSADGSLPGSGILQARHPL